MAKFKKIICTVLLIVFSMTILAGCSLFNLNQERYRNQNVMTVGTEEITLGEVIDFFETNGSQYLQGGYAVQDIWDMLYPQFIQKKIMVSEYKMQFNGANANKSALAAKYKDGKYISDEKITYIRKAVYYSFYQALDTVTLKELAAKFTFKTAEETAVRVPMKDYGANFTPVDEEGLLDMAAMDKALGFYPADQDFESVKYVFENDDSRLTETIDALNKRLVKDDDTDVDLTAAEYIKAQKTAVSSTRKNITKSKSQTLEEFFVSSIEEQINTQIGNQYLLSESKKIMDTITETEFNTRLQNLTEQAANDFAQQESTFATFITGLKEDSFVFSIPDKYKGQYSYIKSLLIPFSKEQTTALNNAKTQYGAGTNEYNNFRDKLSTQIKVKDYSTKDVGVDTEIDVNSIFNNKTFDGVNLSAMSKTEFMSLIYKYNTDPGMLNPTHSYIIAKNASITGGGETFVAEFAAAAKKLANNPSLNYQAIVNDFGIHILYYDGEVGTDSITWAERFNFGIEGGNASYRFFKTMYTELKEVEFAKTIDNLYTIYTKNTDTTRKFVVKKDVLNQYLSGQGIKFDNKK